MSKAIQTLHTCPACGQGGFTAPGLRAHQGNKTCVKRASARAEPAKAGTTQLVSGAEPMKEFDGARKHVASILELGRRAAHTSLLLGLELNRLKAELGIKRGGDRANPQFAGLPPWEQLLEAQTGLSADTCNRCMQLATAAKKHVPLLTAEDVLNKPFNALPEARQKEVLKTLEKAADGRSMSQMMLDFGAWKEKKLNHPPKPTKTSAANRTANAADETLSAATLMKTAEEQAVMLHDFHTGAAWKSLDTGDLASLETLLRAYTADVAAELLARRQEPSAPASKRGRARA